jgi:hypothetical protein
VVVGEETCGTATRTTTTATTEDMKKKNAWDKGDQSRENCAWQMEVKVADRLVACVTAAWGRHEGWTSDANMVEVLRREVKWVLALRLLEYRHHKGIPETHKCCEACYGDYCYQVLGRDWLTEEVHSWFVQHRKDRVRYVTPVLAALDRCRHVRSGRWILKDRRELEGGLWSYIFHKLRGGYGRPEEDALVDQRGLQAIRQAVVLFKLPPLPRSFQTARDLEEGGGGEDNV